MRKRSERIEEKIERIPFSDCEYWMGARNNAGYGFTWYREKVRLAHRVMWELHNGPIPEGMRVLHTCHQGHEGCVAPHHLKLGTQAANMHDAVVAGTHVATKRRKFAAEQVRELRSARAAGVTLAALADEYGISKSSVDNIAKRKCYKEVV